MKMKNNTKKLFSTLLCMVLIVAMALFTTGCAEKTPEADDSSQTQITTNDVVLVGEGQSEFNLAVVDKDGKSTNFVVSTDETTVGGALLACQLIEGEVGPYGLYIKTVNGITADYDVDGTYWAFYINGEYAMTGVDSTDINTENFYTLKAEK